MKAKTISFFLCCALFISSLKSQNWEANVIRNIQSSQTSFLDNTMKFLSNSAYVVVPAVPVGLFVTGLATKNTDMWGGSIQMSIGLAGSALLSLGLKEIIQRDRPFVSHPDIHNWGNEKSYSMPSSHTAFAFSLATSLTLQYPKWYVVAPSYLWAAGVAYSRMYLGVHYPSDLIIGALIGIACSVAGYYLVPVSKFK